MRQRTIGRARGTFPSIVLFVLLTQVLCAQGRLDEIGRFMWQGREIVGIRVGPGLPPPVRPAAVLLPTPNPLAGTNTLSNVPAWDWCYGCSATSAAMMVGYYDNGTYSNMYTGPTNGGVCPMNNETAWASGEAPLSATHQGFDGLATRGHVDDYWVSYGDPGPDPYVTNGWVEHTWGDCTGDYMGTNQAKYGNSDGGTTFFFYTNGDPLYDYTGMEPTYKDGCHGMKAFVESRGYSIASSQAFTQFIYPNPLYPSNTHGFTFDDFKSAIDDGQPVMIQVQGHSMVGFGYDDTGQSVYLRNTWDHLAHSMPWGGSYSGMTHYAVSCLQLPVNRPPTDPTSVTITPTDPKTGDNLIATASGSTDPDPGDTVTYEYQWSKDNWANTISGNPLSSTNTAKGEQWKARARATDGTLFSNWVESSPVTIGNTAPSDPTDVSITPSDPQAADDLTATATGSDDVDSDPVSYEYQWAKSTNQGGSWSSWGWAGATLDDSNTASGEWWKAQAQPYDGSDYGNWVESAPVEIGNNPPTDPTSCTISPADPKTLDDLTASASGSTDPDPGDTVTYEYQWAQSTDDGQTWSQWADGASVLASSNTAKGDQWKARARAFDGIGYSQNWLASAPVTIGNTTPTDPTGVDISPTSPNTTDDLSAAGSGSTDPDTADTVTYEYQWAKWEGSVWSDWGNDGPTLGSANTARGDQWKAQGRAYDGTAHSNWLESAPVTIVNSPPTDPTAVDVTPTTPDTTDDLTVAGSGSVDPDPGDTVTYLYQWAVSTDDGQTWGPWGNDGATLDSSNTTNGDQWKARASASDGTDPSNWVESAPVTIANSPPTIEWVGVTGYAGEGVEPDTGAPGALFTFAAKIKDADGTKPRRLTLQIQRLGDGRQWAHHGSVRLFPVTGSSWSDGMTCGARTTLPNGVYRYRFRARDESATATGEACKWTLGPKIDAAPQLWCTALVGRTGDFVHANAGTADETLFKFAVQYTDGEGNMPTTRQIKLQRRRTNGTWGPYRAADMVAWAGTPRRGKYYAWKSKLPEGEYRYRFIFSDADGSATGSDSSYADATRWQLGPIVSEGTSDATCGSAALLTSISAVPSAAGAEIVVSLGSAAQISARVINIAGRPINTVCRSMDCEAGTSSLLWNAQSDTGLPVPNGTYLVEVVAKAPDGAQTRALTQVRISR